MSSRSSSSRSLYGDSNAKNNPSNIISQLGPFLSSYLSTALSKGVDSVIGAVSPNAGTFTSLQALGRDMKSMIWDPFTGRLKITGMLQSDLYACSIERIVYDPTLGFDPPLVIDVSKQTTILMFPILDTNGSEYEVTLPNGTVDGQNKTILLSQGHNIKIKGMIFIGESSDTTANTSLDQLQNAQDICLRHMGTYINLIWDIQQRVWFSIGGYFFIDA
jgi:hypothetical protein